MLLSAVRSSESTGWEFWRVLDWLCVAECVSCINTKVQVDVNVVCVIVCVCVFVSALSPALNLPTISPTPTAAIGNDLQISPAVAPVVSCFTAVSCVA